MNHGIRIGMGLMTMFFGLSCGSPEDVPSDEEPIGFGTGAEIIYGPPKPKVAPFTSLGGVCGRLYQNCTSPDLMLGTFQRTKKTNIKAGCTGSLQGGDRAISLSYSVTRLVNDHKGKTDDIKWSMRVLEPGRRVRIEYYRNRAKVAGHEIVAWSPDATPISEGEWVDLERGGFEAAMTMATDRSLMERARDAAGACNERSRGRPFDCVIGFAVDCAFCRLQQIGGAGLLVGTGGTAAAAAGTAGAGSMAVGAIAGGSEALATGFLIWWDCEATCAKSNCNKRYCECIGEPSGTAKKPEDQCASDQAMCCQQSSGLYCTDCRMCR
jgi:hypothetical protein